MANSASSQPRTPYWSLRTSTEGQSRCVPEQRDTQGRIMVLRVWLPHAHGRLSQGRRSPPPTCCSICVSTSASVVFFELRADEFHDVCPEVDDFRRLTSGHAASCKPFEPVPISLPFVSIVPNLLVSRSVRVLSV